MLYFIFIILVHTESGSTSTASYRYLISINNILNWYFYLFLIAV